MRGVLGGVALLVVLAACRASDARSGPLARTGAPLGAAPLSAALRFDDDLIAATIRDFAAGGAAGRFRTAKERADLVALYPSGAAGALWLDGDGLPNDAARDALALLAGSQAHGLVPDDYRAGALTSLAADLTTIRPREALARFELSASLHVLRYWRDLHMGRVDPRTLGFRLNAPLDDHDFPAMLRAAVTAGRLGAATGELVPPLVLYRSLVIALDRYRQLEARERPLEVPAPKRSFKPGEAVGGLASLGRRLILVGDLPADARQPADVYDGVLVEGVKRFQARHGLETDGALGPSTLAALQVPIKARIHQLELALERLRWLPHLEEEGFLAVNIPMFGLWGWGHVPPDGSPAFDMGVIVGRALNTQTPVFIDQMESVIFRPYWNVPPSILRGEILPAIAKDPAYLARNDMEIVAGPGDDARAVTASDESVALLRQGRLRVRQRPGPKNSLGLVKFVFPNDDNIYMHGTPAQQLFGRARRDFSHGCIRVENPVRLAEWVLRDQPDWTRERILSAMNGPASQRVTLTRPLQVILFYLSAVVMPEDGSVHFAEDIYGHDGKLASALAERRDK